MRQSFPTRNSVKWATDMADQLNRNWDDLAEYDGLSVVFYPSHATVDMGHGVSVTVERTAFFGHSDSE